MLVIGVFRTFSALHRRCLTGFDYASGYANYLQQLLKQSVIQDFSSRNQHFNNSFFFAFYHEWINITIWKLLYKTIIANQIQNFGYIRNFNICPVINLIAFVYSAKSFEITFPVVFSFFFFLPVAVFIILYTKRCEQDRIAFIGDTGKCFCYEILYVQAWPICFRRSSSGILAFSQWKHLHYHNAYGHQTWQGDDTQWRTPTHKITWSFNHVVLWGHLKN